MTLTETTCMMLENVRLAIEVLTGERTRIKHVELDLVAQTGRGRVYVGEKERGFKFYVHFQKCFDLDSFLYFSFDDWDNDPANYDPTIYTARFDTPDEVRVINESNPRKGKGDKALWTAGRSATDRWLTPLYQ